MHPLAGKPAPRESLIDVSALEAAYYNVRPDPKQPHQRVAFGTSGHRGSALSGSFNEAHIQAITKAIVEHRAKKGITGPMFLAHDTHALSWPALRTVVEVLAANGVEFFVSAGLKPVPTPAASHAILTYNRGRTEGLADGMVVTPSHNPPEDGGLKYDPPHGGPAEAEVTRAIEARANELLGTGEIRRIPFERVELRHHDYVSSYVEDLKSAIDMDVIARSGLALGADPLGGTALAFLDAISDRYRIPIEVVNRTVDPTFGFMPLDHDGRIRMDCSSPHAMAGLVGLKDRYDLAFGNDPDADRHGIVTRSGGLMDPNQYLAAAIWYLFHHRPNWPREAFVGKTLVSSLMIDKVAQALGRRVYEVPVGFKWFVQALLGGEAAFAGEESAGASFLRMDGTVWTTDKDGILLGLAAAELTARLGKDPAALYGELEQRFGRSTYRRVDGPATAKERALLKRISPEDVRIDTLAGEPVLEKLVTAPGNGEPILGLKVVSRNGWFAVRPSGTEDVYKIYAESLLCEDHLEAILAKAQEVVGEVLSHGETTDSA